MTRRTLLLLLVGLVLIGAGVILVSRNRFQPPAGYEAITVGMSPPEVRAVLHAGAETQAIDDETTVDICFSDQMDGLVLVTYRNGRVIAKEFQPPQGLLDKLADWWEWVRSPPPAITPPAMTVPQL